MASTKYQKYINSFIVDYLLSPYKIKILRVKNNSYRFNTGKDNKYYLDKISTLEANIKLINDNIDDKYLKNLDILFRNPIEVASEYLGINKHEVSLLKKEIREQFEHLMIQEGLI